MKRGASISQQVLGIFAVFAVLSLTMPGNARAEELKYTLTDPAGDHTGDIDVTMLEFLFDNATGEYEITLRATVPNPFLGVFPRSNCSLQSRYWEPDAESVLFSSRAGLQPRNTAYYDSPDLGQRCQASLMEKWRSSSSEQHSVRGPE